MLAFGEAKVGYSMVKEPRFLRVLAACAGLIAVLAAADAAAQSPGKDIPTERNVKALTEPILFPGNGSYFQLIDDRRLAPNGLTWQNARNFAAARTDVPGRRSRLAIIDDADLYAWILQTFDLRSLSYGGTTWIGFRHWCAFRKVTDSEGKDYPSGAFAAWDEPWYRDDGVRCETLGATAIPYMGVYIAGTTTQRWQATGYLKVFPFYLVEYPPPEETAAAAEVPETGAPPR